ncbi:helix-turn-helix domain-containing protein [Thermosulfidibacter takaii]|nr:helix-turn-helix transcriptional regulator [Thermosulfidibacter takaii]
MTCLFPFFTGYEPYTLTIIGISSAVVIVRIGCILANTDDHVLSSAFGLAIGNVFLALLLALKLPERFFFLIIGLPLSIALFSRCPDQQKGRLGDIMFYLPLVSMFYLFIGTFYVCLMPAYIKYMYLNGIELAFYILAVLLSAYLFSIKPELSFAVGVSLGLIATSFLHNFNKLNSNLAMFTVQAAVGFTDVFCFGLFLKHKENAAQRFGIGAGCMLAGPAVGMSIINLEKWPLILSTYGNFILAFLFIAFHLTNLIKAKPKSLQQAFDENTVEDKLKALCSSRGISSDTLSYREWETLKLCATGLTIKEIAEKLEISESSVKTYLRRAYIKLDVNSKKEFLALLKNLDNQNITNL